MFLQTKEFQCDHTMVFHKKYALGIIASTQTNVIIFNDFPDPSKETMMIPQS